MQHTPEPQQRDAFVVVALTLALLASVAVACGTFLIMPPPTPVPSLAPTALVEAPEATATLAPPPTATSPASTTTPVPATASRVPPTPARLPPTASPLPPTPTMETEARAMMADARHGQELFNRLGCMACHGAQGEGGVGPTIAQTELPLERVVRQYRAPYRNMPRFGPDQVSEADIADIYAYLHTLPTPEAPVPSILLQVTPETGIGTIRGIIRYAETETPAVGEEIYVVPAAENPDGSLSFTYLPHLPAGVTDAGGRFEIADLEAGRYAVFYSRQEAPVRDAGGNLVLVNVLPGEVAEVEGFIPPP